MRLGPFTIPSLSAPGRAGPPPAIPIPPEPLRHRVHGAPDVESFLAVGEACTRDIRAAVERLGRPLTSFRSVLDFGCGCGRTLRFFAQEARHVRFFGTDIDGEAIGWCRENIPYARFGTNLALPPLVYRDRSFDLIYAISVFSHLNEDFQFRWLAELRRVLKPAGILLASVHGEFAAAELPPEGMRQFVATGFLFGVSESNGVFPDWYQTAFHSPDYVRREFARFFDVLDVVPRGMNNHQDLVILRRD